MPVPADDAAAVSQKGALRSLRDYLAAQVRDGTMPPLELPPMYSDGADRYLARLLDEASGGDHGGCALVAVGGYGRRQLCPGSDLDVVLIHHRRRDFAKVADRVWYSIWDGGVRLDHSVRTPKEAVAVAKDDLLAMLGLLDGRRIAGDERVVASMLAEIGALWRAHARRYVPELARICEERVGLFGELPFLLEPDLKEARGGLRDVEAMQAAARAIPTLAGILAPPSLDEPRRQLLAARVALHALTGTHSDRLLLQDQDQMAPVLGYADADALMAGLASAGREVLWTADDAWRRTRSFVAGPTGRAGGRDRPLETGLVLRDGEVALAADASPAEDTSLLVRAARAAAANGAHLAPATLERLTSEAAPPPDPWPAELTQAFVSLLGCGPLAIPVIEVLDQRRLIERLLPEWSAVRNRPQRNAYHRYTVDRHLLEAVARAAGLVRSVARPDLLLLGALFHDIGKGFPGDHSESGRVAAEKIARRMGFPPADVEVLGRLVALHLLLPDTATRRDLDDPTTIEAVARSAGDRTTLELLGALAEADGLATGSAAWGPWKAELVATLVERVLRQLAGEAAPQRGAGLPTAQQRALMAGGRLAVRSEGTTVTVVAPDRHALLAAVTGTLELHRMGIRRAVVLPGEDGMALEIFEVEMVSGSTPDWALVERDLGAVLDGRLLLEARLESLQSAYARGRRAAAPGPARVRILVDNDASATATVLEVRAPDDNGLLHRLTLAIATAGLDVVSAQVSTLGHEIVDAFYVRDSTGGKVADETSLQAVTAALEAAATPS